MRRKRPMRLSTRLQWRLTPAYLLATLWLALMAAMLLWIILASFSNTRAIFAGEIMTAGFQLKNYHTALVKFNVGTYFLNSVAYTSITCVGTILLSAPAAYALSRFRFRGNRGTQTLIVIAQGIPGIMIILPLFGLAASMNLTNMRSVLVLLYICMAMPFTTFFLMVFFGKLSLSFEEAAAIDGCGPVKTFWRVMLPLAQPGIITVTIFNFIGYWNEYFMALVFTTKNEYRPVSVGLYSMITSMRYIGDWGAMFAAVVVVFMPTFLLYLFLSEKIISGVTGGAIKG